ncbi:MAG TPA: hypothetical protein VH298_01240 [Jatrophihabitans sp.]|jgi:hypothetical protein|nr:hypothetical protein [Jatrophihabitans sp.]
MSYGILWIVLVLAILAIAAGAVTVRSGRVAVPWLRGRVIWQRWGWAMVALGLFMVLEAMPRLVGYSDGWVFVLSSVAVLPLVIGLVLNHSAQLPRA